MTSGRNILLTNSSTIYGGGEYYVLELAKGLSARGYSVTVACKPGTLLKQKLENAGVTVSPVDFPAQGALLAHILKLARIVRERHINVVHSNSNYDRTAGAFAALKEGVPHVTNVHSFHSLRRNVTHALRNRYATRRFIVDGYCVKEMLVRDDKIPEDKIAVVHLGVDPQSMTRNLPDRNRIRAEFGFEDDAIVIGNVARFVPFKGQEYLIRAFAQIQQIHSRARLLLVGDGELVESSKKLASDLGVGINTKFTGFRDDLTSIYSAFDVYAHPSIEGRSE